MRLTPLRIIGASVLSVFIWANFASASTVNVQLGTVLPELKFDGVSLGDALDFLRDVSGANIVVNWKVLEGQGVSKDTPINVRLREVTLRRALGLVLSEVGGSGKIGYNVDENVIEITSQEAIDSHMYTRVYPVQDLIMEVPDFTDAPDFNLASSSSTSNQAGGGGASGSSSGLFSGSGSGGKSQDTKTTSQRANDLIELIRTTIQPEIWQENGGKATIRFFNGNLVITAPRSAQEAIGGAFD